jgi:hypothetical protein
MRWLCRLTGALLVLGMSAAAAIEFRPHPRERITEAQWRDYFAQVRAAHAGSMQELKEHRLVTFHDSATVTSYAFTQPGHPAHPAWITRRIILGPESRVEQIGYFAGNEAPFAELFRQYQVTNQRMIEEMRGQRGR